MATVERVASALTASQPSAAAVSPARLLGYLLLAAGAIAGISRFVFGLGATTNLNDGYPWGLWISFDVMTGVALAAGGFILSAAVYVFHLEKFRPLVWPARLSAFVGYVMVVLGLALDAGLPWRLWHPLIMWNPRSALFAVSWCEMLYTAVLAVDVFAMVLEARREERWVRFLRSIYVGLVVASIVLSTVHQSSLGAMYLLIPEKMSALWASPWLGPLFYSSAIAGGLAVVILESLLRARPHGQAPDVELLASLGKGLALALLVTFAIKVTDLYARGVHAWAVDEAHLLFYAEIFGTVALPAALLGFPEIRRTRTGLLWCAGLAAFGVALNRFNVSLTSYAGYGSFRYFPSVAELSVTLGSVSLAILVFDFAARRLPLHADHHLISPQRSRNVTVSAGGEAIRTR